ncbi:hypothetical protein E2C01_024241 [Portunus trituberculatus]|uniref:Uncharacterized protein n=1 Tax=Portunus trituberculatus TaxID=210409 RepID=A0A5B7ECC2_PORTR|nr:hypothetical protein [Portunus trituberculatus]
MSIDYCSSRESGVKSCLSRRRWAGPRGGREIGWGRNTLPEYGFGWRGGVAVVTEAVSDVVTAGLMGALVLMAWWRRGGGEAPVPCLPLPRHRERVGAALHLSPTTVEIQHILTSSTAGVAALTVAGKMIGHCGELGPQCLTLRSEIRASARTFPPIRE